MLLQFCSSTNWGNLLAEKEKEKKRKQHIQGIRCKKSISAYLEMHFKKSCRVNNAKNGVEKVIIVVWQKKVKRLRVRLTIIAQFRT